MAIVHNPPPDLAAEYRRMSMALEQAQGENAQMGNQAMQLVTQAAATTKRAEAAEAALVAETHRAEAAEAALSAVQAELAAVKAVVSK